MDLPAEITVRVGDRMSYPITSAGSVGYHWRLELRGDASAAAASTETIEPLPADRPPGGSYPEALSVRGLAPGTCTIEMRLLRGRETTAYESHEIAVTVVPSA